MRILYLTNGFPYPLTSGYLRHYFLIRGLAERHSVSLLSMVGRNFRNEHREALAPFTHRVATFGKPGGSRSKVRKAFTAMRAAVPTLDRQNPVEEMRTAVRRSLRDEKYDIVLFSGKQTYPAIAGLRSVPVVADICDATSVRIRGRMQHCGIGRIPALYAEYLHVRGVERRLVRQANHLVFASCRDREALLGGDGAHTSVIPNGVDLDFWSRNPGTPRGLDTMVLTGAMDYAPNKDAALFLIEQILPRVRRRVPGARLLIVGRDAPPDLVHAGKQAGACVTGLVPDVRPYLEEATVFVAPLRFGAGIQNKLLEAMAMGVPVVASPLAAEGLRTENGEVPPLVLARTPEKYVEHIVRSFEQARMNPEPDLDARAYVARNFVWSTSTARLEQVMASLAGRNGS
jgi:glycosyltransferase involved in cell wall biosynthesis